MVTELIKTLHTITGYKITILKLIALPLHTPKISNYKYSLLKYY